MTGLIPTPVKYLGIGISLVVIFLKPASKLGWYL